MTQLPTPEMVTFVIVVLVHLAAAIAAILQLRPTGESYKKLLHPLITLGIVLLAIILILRAAKINAIPLAGLFDSMIIMTISFSLIFLFFNVVIKQIWFSSVMVWLILAMILMTGLVAAPAEQPQDVAKTPWAIAHAIAMVLSAVAIAYATATAWLYLFAAKRLKQKDLTKVLGKIPNLQKLGNWNLGALKACFVIITFGLTTGLGLSITVIRSSPHPMTFTDFLIDPKIILITAAWLLLAIILLLRRVIALKEKKIAYATLLAFFLILFAIAGVTAFCGTKHDFVKTEKKAVHTTESIDK